jgi:hypothetical protein
MSNPVLVHVETVLLSVQNRCTCWARQTVGSGFVLDAPDGVTWLKWKLVSVCSEIVQILTQAR